MFLGSRQNSHQSQFVLSVTQSVTYLEELVKIKLDSPSVDSAFLDKTYAFSFQSNIYKMSFNQVMACTCLENAPLKLKKSFFSSIFTLNSLDSLSTAIVDSPDSPYDIQVII